MSIKERVYVGLDLVRNEFLTPFCLSICLISILVYFTNLYIGGNIERNVLEIFIFICAYVGLINWLFKEPFSRSKILLSKFLQYLFLISIIFLFVLHFLSLFSINYSEFIENNLPIFILTSFTTGLVTIFLNREKLDALKAKNEPEKKELAEKTVSKKFWNKKNSLLISSLIIILGCSMLFFQLGKNNFMNDEFQTMDSGWNFEQVGNFYKWDWLQNKSSEYTPLGQQDQYADYIRAEVHTVLLSISYRLFGVSEFSSRLVSVIFGILFSLIIFPIIKFSQKSRQASFLALTLSIFSPTIIFYERYTRMYALLIPIILLTLFLIFYLINQTIFSEKRIESKRKLILLIFGTIFLFLVSFNLHDLTLIYIPGILIYCLYLLFVKNKKLFFYLLLLIGFGLLAFTALFVQIKSIDKAFDFLNITGVRNYPYNYTYFNYLFTYPLGVVSFLITSLYFLYEMLFSKIKNYFFIFLYIITSIVLISVIFFTDRFANAAYTAPFVSLVIILISISCYYFCQLFEQKSLRYIFYSAIIAASLCTFYLNLNVIYGNGVYYYANYARAYSILIADFNPRQDVLFIQYERYYYLRGLGSNVTVYRFGQKDYSEAGEQQFLNEIKSTKSGWVTWENYTAGDIQTNTLEFIMQNFQNFSIPGTDVYLYHYNTSELESKGVL
ncbi:MAG: glycosyltransferase family 39 protein [Minisyncoccia bacterium]|jgi:4-amino-4-deoxy-L-arabinose transferase-like glycosyltransferase